MLASVKRYWRKRQLAFVHALSRMLLTRYGGQPSYTTGQVRRAAEALRIRGAVRDYAFAACCSRDEFSKALPDRPPSDYDRLRGELMDVFQIGTSAFTCVHLRALKQVPGSNRWAVIADGQQGAYGGGTPSDGHVTGGD